MKTSNKILVGLFAALALIALTGMVILRSNLEPQRIGNGSTFIEGSNVLKTITPPIKNFSQLHLNERFLVTLIQGKEFVEIEAEDNLLDYISVAVSPKGRLTIGAKEGYSLKQNKAIRIKIGFDSLRHINLSHNVHLSATETLQFDELEVVANQLSKFELPLRTKKLTLKIQNNVQAKVEGSTEDLEISTYNSGQIDATKLTAKNAQVESSNSSQVHLNVSDYLKIRAQNRSRVYYAGNPKIKEHTSNSARVIKNN